MKKVLLGRDSLKILSNLGIIYFSNSLIYFKINFSMTVVIQYYISFMYTA